MPHTTSAYPFESKVVAFACRLCEQFSSGPVLRSFVLVLDEQGNVLSLNFAESAPDWREQVQHLTQSEVPHLLFEPLAGGMEHIWLSWRNVGRSTMERLIGVAFEGSDFLPADAHQGRAGRLQPEGRYPESWGVMF